MGGFIESEDENEETEENLKQPESVDKIEPKSSAIDLPMTESSEAWMDDRDPVGFIESEEENEETEENLKQPENVDKIEPKSSAIDLPMTESSEAWMDDG